MRCHRLAAVLWLFLVLFPTTAEEPATALLTDIQAAARQPVPASPAARAAWEKLVSRGPAVLPELLAAMDTPDTVVANWLRTAFDRIVDTEWRRGGKGLDAEALLAVVKDAKHQGRVRRLALEVVEKLRPGTTARLTPGWLDDPEYRFEAVAALIQDADAQSKKGQKDVALATYRKAFDAVRDAAQAQLLAGRLKDAGAEVSVARHLGFVTDWFVVGPLDAAGQKGFQTSYPPETKVDLQAEVPGKDGPLRWKRYRARESLTAGPARVVLVNLLEPLGRADDAVAFAYSALKVKEGGEVEFRGSGDDNISVWVNGHRVFGFEEYRNGIRLDRHRFKARLRPGVNTVLVKICQAPADPNNNEPNWEFILRAVDATGKGIDFTSALPEEKTP